MCVCFFFCCCLLQNQMKQKVKVKLKNLQKRQITNKNPLLQLIVHPIPLIWIPPEQKKNSLRSIFDYCIYYNFSYPCASGIHSILYFMCADVSSARSALFQSLMLQKSNKWTKRIAHQINHANEIEQKEADWTKWWWEFFIFVLSWTIIINMEMKRFVRTELQ